MVNFLQEVRCDFDARCSLIDLLCVIGAADNAAHKIFIWDIVNDGQFVTTLDGGREPLLHLHVYVPSCVVGI